MADKISRTKALANNGELLRAWNIKDGGWNLTIVPTLSIDKVKFSYFQTGKQGQGFDLFVDAGTFYTWCQDLLDKSMLKTLAAEVAAGEKYPKYYNIPNFGNEGKNSFGMALAQKAGHIVFNGKKDQQRAIVPVPIMGEDGLRLAAEKYVRIYSTYLDELSKETASNAGKFFKDNEHKVEADTPPIEENTEKEKTDESISVNASPEDIAEVAALFKAAPEAAPKKMPFVGIIQSQPVAAPDGSQIFKAMVDGEVVGIKFTGEVPAAVAAGTGEFKCIGDKHDKLIVVEMFL